jgi:alpha-glucosidase (family GH31 glycosyl hydrolase)
MSQSKLEKLNAEIVLEDNELIKANPRQVPVGNNNPLIQSVSFEFGQADFKTAYVKLTDANADRYSPPESVVNKLSANGMMKLDMCGFEMFNDPFGFKFTDDKTGDAILTTENSAFIMMDKYMQLDMTLPSRRIFGLGERTKSFLVGEGTWTMWANGQQTPTDNGLGGNQTYGVHPFMLVQTATPGEYFGVYFRNTNAMSPVIQHTGESQSTFSYITTGGQIEIYLMFKGGPKDIIKQYQNIIGKPVLPPFWSLGWHAAAYAYTTQAMVQENIDGYATAGIPLEGIWLDIPYLDGYSDFSVNATAFPTVKDMTDTIHANGQRMIVIVDAGISSDNV